ncbi:MAG TPA: NAD-dependent epimerase/dehydratase family protein [Actinophytocola sp.]|nr:NAD-dependent epimerase/dehydratase family protein [Actinophytocola sp.]
MSKVLVTGATGFLAGHCVAELLEHGHSVRGTVRSLADPARFAHLGPDVELVEADLRDDRGWAAAAAGCDAVLHVASPFPDTPPRDERELIGPAVDGTLRVLRAAAAAGVRRVVLTSSIAAVSAGRRPGDDRVRTEADWSDVDRSPAYPKSKTLAERAAWRFVEEHPELELVTLNPGMILGPVRNASASTSVAVVRRLLNREMPAVPKLGFAMVDVRDLATAHRLAMENPAAAGNRYICAGENRWLPDLAAMLAEEFNPRGHRVPTGRLPYWLMWTIARFDRGLRLGLDFANRPERVDASKAVRELGWRMRPVRESLVDTAESLLAHGVVPVRGVSRARPADRHPRPVPRS